MYFTKEVYTFAVPIQLKLNKISKTTIMKALYLTLATAILLAVLMGGAAVQFAAIGAALGWVFFEDKKAKEVRR